MNGFHVFNGKRSLHLVQEDGPQVMGKRRNKPRPVESRWQEKRLVLRFVKGLSVEQIAIREEVLRLDVQRALRAALVELQAPKVIEMPLPLERRKAA